MKLPSIDKLIDQSAATAKRFPATLLIAFIGTFTAIFLVQNESHVKDMRFYGNIIHTCILGISFLISLTLFAERKKYEKSMLAIVQVVGIVILVAYYFYLPDKWSIIHVIRALLLGLSLHCLTAFAAFIAQGNMQGFWQFNKTIFIQILTSALYSAVLFFGISLAIIAVRQLFNIQINEKVFAQLWIFLVGIFNTWFFLSGVPSNYEELDTDTDYPRGLKIFTQFVLIPLVTIYLLILYIYMLKIVVLWELPKGWVSYLVLGFSTLGVLSLLLVYPLQNSESEKWIKIYSRWFYLALFPLIILLFVAIGTRVSDYGITENRYFIMLLAFWLAGISIYLLINKLHNIKVIPISLCIIAALSSFGPWSAFNVSQYSQVKRLTNYLKAYNMLIDGKATKSKAKLDEKEQNELSSIIHYLNDIHGYQSMKHLFNENLDSISKANNNNENISYRINEILGLSGSDKYPNYDYFNYSINQDSMNVYDIKGYDYFIKSNLYLTRNDTLNNERIFKLDKDDLKAVYQNDTLTLQYQTDKFSIDVKALHQKLNGKYGANYYTIKDEDVTFTEKGKLIDMKIVILTLYGNYHDKGDEFYVTDLSFWCLVSMKK